GRAPHRGCVALRTPALLPDCRVRALRLPRLRSLSDARNHLRRESRLRWSMAIVHLPETLPPDKRRRLVAALVRILARRALEDHRQTLIPVEESALTTL